MAFLNEDLNEKVYTEMANKVEEIDSELHGEGYDGLPSFSQTQPMHLEEDFEVVSRAYMRSY